MRVLLLLLCAMVIVVGHARADDATYARQIEQERADRLARLTRDDGWLTLVGLHFLERGVNSIGSGSDNHVVLAAGPEHVGRVTVSEDGTVLLKAIEGSGTSLDGQVLGADEVRIDGGGERAPLVRLGTVSFFVIDRGGRKALRVRDSAAERRVHFEGLEYFPVDPAWCVDAQWVPFETIQEIEITNVLGAVSIERVTGKVVFNHSGRDHELVPLVDADDGSLFFIFADATSGEETYGMRFLYADAPKDGKVRLDFNLAVNPPCAFTPFATCPLPPKGNVLLVAVRAGEKHSFDSKE